MHHHRLCYRNVEVAGSAGFLGCGVKHPCKVAATSSLEDTECVRMITAQGLVSSCYTGTKRLVAAYSHVWVWPLSTSWGHCATHFQGELFSLQSMEMAIWELCSAQPVQLNVTVLILSFIMIDCYNRLLTSCPPICHPCIFCTLLLCHPSRPTLLQVPSPLRLLPAVVPSSLAGALVVESCF